MLLRQLKKQSGALGNLSHALKLHPKPEQQVGLSLQKVLTTLKDEISVLESKITQISEDEFNDVLGLITSIKGIDQKTTSALIMATNGLKNFASAKKLAKFIGTVPIINQSGSSLNIRGSISKSGDADIRSLLYMSACSAARFNKTCKELYDRLRLAGKKAKIALIEVANKLIRQIFAVVKSNIPYHLILNQSKNKICSLLFITVHCG